MLKSEKALSSLFVVLLLIGLGWPLASGGSTIAVPDELGYEFMGF